MLTKDVLCPVAGMLSYLACRPPDEGFIFKFKDGKPLSHDRLCCELGLALQEVGVNTSGYSGHSFRIGEATTAARAGLGDSLMQVLGRWKSTAFMEYIRTDVDTLKGTAKKLSSSV